MWKKAQVFKHDGGIVLVQNIRRSQFVLTYGPGAIIESQKGPRIIPLPDIGLFKQNSSLSPVSFEISDRRMSQALLSGARIFRLPSNAELGLDQEKAIYYTKPFPEWKLCQNFQGHNGQSILYRGYRCPVCRQGTRQEAIRFIRACRSGHMDDVDWSHLVHSNSSSCSHDTWFFWIGEGGSLGKVRILCPKCKKQINLGKAYKESWPCSGRYPEREFLNTPPIRPGCSENSRIIQRQASNLRIPELRTLFSISNKYTPTILHNLLQLSPIYHALSAVGEPSDFNQFEKILSNLKSKNLISKTVFEKVLGYNWEDLKNTIIDVLTMSQSNLTYNDLLYEEFLGLTLASKKGAPPVSGPTPSSPVIFEVRPKEIKKYKGPNGATFRVTPIARLRTVTVQIGYRRAVGQIISEGSPPPIQDVSMRDSINREERWYPGTEFFGEGIYVMFDDDTWQFNPKSDSWSSWLKSYNNPEVYEQANFAFRVPGEYTELHPAFVWWHTLSHLIIRAISIEAGYTAPSIRERIYLEIDENKPRGGFILYATQPGSEGTMGGLISLVPHFKQILDTAVDMLDNCSSDPLCTSNHFKHGNYSGASCYACTLLSETSCEHRNLWIDRNILLESRP